MESISVATGTGLHASDVECFAVGATRRETKNSTPDDPRHYYQLQLAPSAQGEPVYCFCEAEQAERVAAAIKSAGAAVPVIVSLVIGKRGNNVSSVQL